MAVCGRAIRVASRRTTPEPTRFGSCAHPALRLLAHADHLRAGRGGRRAAVGGAASTATTWSGPRAGRPRAGAPSWSAARPTAPAPTCCPPTATRAPRCTSTAARPGGCGTASTWFTELGRPAALPAGPRRRPGADHPGAGRPARRPLRRRRRRPGRRDDRLRPGAARRTGRPPTCATRSSGSTRTGSSEPEVLVSGPDFVAAPRLHPNGVTLAWLQWNHPSMPWDDVQLRTRNLITGEEIRGGRRPGGVGVRAELAPRRLAVVPLRPDRLVEPLPLAAGHRHRGGGPAGRRDRRARRGPSAARATPCWTTGGWSFARRRAGFDAPRGARPGRPDHRAGPAVLRDQRGARRRVRAAWSCVAGTPAAEPGVYRVDPDGAPVDRAAPAPGPAASTPATCPCRSAVSFPSTAPDGARAHRARAVLPAGQPRAHRAWRASCRRCWW